MTPKSEKDIFFAALDHESESARYAFVAQACQGDPSLLSAVMSLLQQHEKQSPIDHPIVNEVDLNSRASEDSNHRPGTMIGPYRLMEQIGEGGFGLVFVADQREPVQRRVALKIIKPGMESREVIARFEAERQAIAMMAIRISLASLTLA